MNITNETKAKVFAQYIGQNIQWGDSRNRIITMRLNGDEIDKTSRGELNYLELPKKLILKPFSAITDEDALDVAKFLWPNNTEYQKAYDGKYYVDNLFNEDFEMYSPNSITIYQILQSKGYDLPHYLLGGKTLHEAGLAIYETQK